MQLSLTHITTNFKRYYPKIDVTFENELYIKFNIDTLDLGDGEYHFELLDDKNNLICEEVLRVGDYKNNKVEYKIDKKYTQYVRK